MPSRRRIEFLQKKIRQLKVEFIERNVSFQILKSTACLSLHAVFDVKLQIVNIIPDMEQMKKQPTTKEHVEIFLNFLFRFFLFSSVVKLVGAIL